MILSLAGYKDSLNGVTVEIRQKTSNMVKSQDCAKVETVVIPLFPQASNPSGKVGFEPS